MTEKLKPCPFCGSRLVSYSRGIIGAPILFMKCGNTECGAVVSFDNEKCHTLPEIAIKYWEKRENERPQGRWLQHDEEDTNAWECSVCHNVWQLMDGNPAENGMRYCQRCGAEMALDDTETTHASD